jgi:hypothetical protein
MDRASTSSSRRAQRERISLSDARPVIEQVNVILNDINPPLRKPITLIGDQRWSLVKIQNIPGGAIPTLLYHDGVTLQRVKPAVPTTLGQL